MEAVLTDISVQYKNGATPLIILQDLINLTHDLAKVKIVPTQLDSASLSEIEKQTFFTLSSTCSLAILSKIWQMLLKGINEINIAPSAVEALEMILLRIAYSASLPTPLELLNEVKKNSNLSTVQAPSPAIEKKNNLNADNKSTPTNNDITLNTIEEFLQYLEQTKKALIEYSIKNEVSIDSFSNGNIAMRISPHLHQDFIMNLHKLLSTATGKQWKIDIIKGDIGETIADKEKTIVEAKKKNVAEYPLVKKILEEFRGAKIETMVRKNIEALAETESEYTVEAINAIDIEEE